MTDVMFQKVAGFLRYQRLSEQRRCHLAAFQRVFCLAETLSANVLEVLGSHVGL